MRARLRALVEREQGQAAVETAIVVPMMVFFILGTLQMTMMQQAKLMLEYAAFSAARSGAVWNMDRNKMKQAALLSLLPTMQKVEDVGELAIAAGKYTLINAGLSLLGLPEQVDVEVLSPKESDFGGKKEIVFDDPANRAKTLMTIRVRYMYELRLPVINWMIWESWFASLAAVQLTGFNPLMPEVAVDAGPFSTGVEMPLDARLAWEAANIDVSKSCPYTGVNNDKMLLLAGVAGTLDRFFIPLVTTYTIRMQSNPFIHNPKDSNDKWAGKAEDDCG